MAVCKETSERLGQLNSVYSIWSYNVYINLGGKMIKKGIKKIYQNFDMDKFWSGYCNRLEKIIRRINLKSMNIDIENFTDDEIDVIVRKIYKDMEVAGTTAKEAEKSLKFAFAEIQKSGLLI